VKAGTIVTVTPNPALDLTYTVEGIMLGTSHRVTEPLARAGGKGLNVARVAHAQGRTVLAVAPAGGPTGKLFRTELEASGVPSRLVDSPSETRRSLAFVDTAGRHDPTLFNEAGPDQPAEVLAELLASARTAAAGSPDQRTAVIVGAGSLPGPSGLALMGEAGFYVCLARAAASAGAQCILDTSGAALLEAAEAGPALLKPNEHELREATGLASPIEGAAELLRRGAQRVLVSCGAKGMLLADASDPGAFLSARLPEALEGNPTGAGDAAVAAVAACLADGVLDHEQILRRAVAWSAAAVLMPVAGEISPQHTALADTVIITRESYSCP
jgi:hypothetical protein